MINSACSLRIAWSFHTWLRALASASAGHQLDRLFCAFPGQKPGASDASNRLKEGKGASSAGAAAGRVTRVDLTQEAPFTLFDRPRDAHRATPPIEQEVPFVDKIWMVARAGRGGDGKCAFALSRGARSGLEAAGGAGGRGGHVYIR